MTSEWELWGYICLRQPISKSAALMTCMCHLFEGADASDKRNIMPECFQSQDGKTLSIILIWFAGWNNTFDELAKSLGFLLPGIWKWDLKWLGKFAFVAVSWVQVGGDPDLGQEEEFLHLVQMQKCTERCLICLFVCLSVCLFVCLLVCSKELLVRLVWWSGQLSDLSCCVESNFSFSSAFGLQTAQTYSKEL